MEGSKIYAILLISVMLAGAFSLYLANASIMNSVVIKSTGNIKTYGTASSGSAKDIQAAVDEVAAAGGGDVYIPEGTWNFVEVGEPWMTVNIPAGVNLYGAPTERTSGYPEPPYGMSPNNQVVEWKTIIQMPFDPFGGVDSRTSRTWMFDVNGDGVQPFRFSDIKLVGYRSLQPAGEQNVNWHGGIHMSNVPNFRVDHCFFEHMTGGAVYMFQCNGVIDHSYLVNYYGATAWSSLSENDNAYGMMIRGTDNWIADIDDVIGHYTDQTVFIEDCYLSRWRHDYSGAMSIHIVFRHNTAEFDSTTGTLDAHGWRTYYLSTRAMEIYKNLIIDPIINWQPDYYSTIPSNGKYGFGVFWRGGGGVAFDNFFRNYHTCIQLSLEGPDVPEMYRIHDVWIWNNTYAENITNRLSVTHASIDENVDYWVVSPPPQPDEDGYYTLFGPTYTGEPSILYKPYSYPHPLTLNV